MQRDFVRWHQKKDTVEKIEKRPFFHERQIWFCYLGTNIGVEMDGGDEFLRPVVILRKFNNESFWAVPLTKAQKPNSPFYFSFSFTEGVMSTANLSQLRLIDARRLSRLIGTISDSDYQKLKAKLTALLP